MPKPSASMVKRTFSAIGPIVFALVSLIAPPVTSYNCSNLTPSRCSKSSSLNAFGRCIVTQYSVSELIQCADQDQESHNLTTDINGNSQTVTPFDILLGASQNSSCSDDSLGAAFNDYNYLVNDGLLGQYLCVVKITDNELCSLSRCLKVTSNERSIEQYCLGDKNDHDYNSTSDEPDLMTQSELSTCRDATSTPGASSTSSTSHTSSFTPSSAGTSSSKSTVPASSIQNNETMTATNSATPQTSSPTATSRTSGSTNSAPARRRSALDSTGLFIALIVLIMDLL